MKNLVFLLCLILMVFGVILIIFGNDKGIFGILIGGLFTIINEGTQELSK